MSSRNAFFLPLQAFQGGFVLIGNKEITHQIRRVLRLRVGDPFLALDGKGYEYECLIHTMEKETIRAQVVAKRAIEHEPAVELVLYPALIRRERFALLLEKCTELGVTRFFPCIAERSVYAQMTPNLVRRWETIIREAAEVVRRGVLPPLHQARPVEEVLQALNIQEGDRAFVLSTRPDVKTHPKNIASIFESKLQRIHLFLGPEGDFTDAEYAAFDAAGIEPLSLGKRILRSETAALAAVTLFTSFS